MKERFVAHLELVFEAWVVFEHVLEEGSSKNIFLEASGDVATDEAVNAEDFGRYSQKMRQQDLANETGSSCQQNRLSAKEFSKLRTCLLLRARLYGDVGHS